MDPYDLMVAAIRRNLLASGRFVTTRRGKRGVARIAVADARELSAVGTGPIDTVITSPPYLNAVDYYRRHQLEMFWLGLVSSAAERLGLRPKYIGRAGVRQQHLRALGTWRPSKLATIWRDKLSSLSNSPSVVSRILHFTRTVSTLPVTSRKDRWKSCCSCGR